MRNLFRAEWIKISGNRWVASCLIWIFPVGAAAVVIVISVILALSSSARRGFTEDNPMLWTKQALAAWSIPNNPVGRMILLGFTAVVFAGEYQWGTWKNTVPRNRRSALILIKFVTLGAFVVIAFVLGSVIWTLGGWILTQIAGVSYGPHVTGSVLKDFAGDYGLAAGLAFTSTLVAAGYAALAGMVTRSILGGVLVGFAATFLENLSIFGLIIVGYFLNIPRVVHLYRLTPGYNLINVASWINDKVATNMDVEVGNKVKYVFSDSLMFSVVVLAAWMGGLVMLTIYLFRKQDISG